MVYTVLAQERPDKDMPAVILSGVVVVIVLLVEVVVQVQLEQQVHQTKEEQVVQVSHLVLLVQV